MANGNRGYADHIYQSSFAGYFRPITLSTVASWWSRNKPFARCHYGAKIAGPVFKELADKLYAVNADKDKKGTALCRRPRKDSLLLFICRRCRRDAAGDEYAAVEIPGFSWRL